MDNKAFIIDWLNHHDEIHAVALQLNKNTGTYNKILLRIEFSDFAYIVFAVDPQPEMIDKARKALKGSANLYLEKKRTTVGYQAEPEIPVLFIRSSNLPETLKNPAIKALGGYTEEFTSISRSRKLTAVRSMSQCCWISLNKTQIIEDDNPIKLSKLKILEYKLPSWQDLEAFPLDSQESFTPPPSSEVKVLSFDIEVYRPSTQGRRMPEATDRLNFVLCISVVVNEGSQRKITLHTIYDVLKFDEYIPDGTRIYRYATEYEMILGFWNQVADANPALILGFNVVSWDFRYLHERMKLYKIGYPNSLSIYARSIDKINMRRSQWSSEAFKYNDILYPSIPGMVILDLHKFYSRNQPRLPKHSLGFISQLYLGRTKYPMSQERMVKAYESKDPDELSAMAQYNIEDSMLVLDLFLRQQIFEEVAIEAITSDTLIDDLYTKGSQLRDLNKFYRYAKEDDYVVTFNEALSITRLPGTGGGERLIGALVYAPLPGRFEDVAVYDVKSMYPTLLLANNICYTTFVIEESPSVEHKTFEWEGKTSGVDKVSFVTINVRKGVCTRLLEDQLKLREKFKSWGSGSIVKRAQQGVKNVSNSLIGVMAMNPDMSKMAFTAAAGVVYTMARKTIRNVINDINEQLRVVYSDTDSVFVSNMSEEKRRSELLKYLNDTYDPLTFELETVARVLVIAPKTYIMRIPESQALIYKGVSFSKKTASYFIADTMKSVTSMIMDENKSREQILEFTKSKIAEISSLPIEDFLMTATVSTSLRSVGGRLGKRLMSKGEIIHPGDSIDYLVLTKPIDSCEKPKKSLGVTERTATLKEFESSQCQAQIDFDYYADSLRNSTDRLLVF